MDITFERVQTLKETTSGKLPFSCKIDILLHHRLYWLATLFERVQAVVGYFEDPSAVNQAVTASQISV